MLAVLNKMSIDVQDFFRDHSRLCHHFLFAFSEGWCDRGAKNVSTTLRSNNRLGKKKSDYFCIRCKVLSNQDLR